MNPDRFFKQMERRTERELYRRSFRAVTESQDSMFKKFENNKREKFKQGVAREVKWFFLSLLLSPVMAFIFYYLFANLIPNQMVDLALYFDGIETLFFVIVGFCFLCIYLARIMVWALKR